MFPHCWKNWIAKNVLLCWRFPFTGSKGSNPTPEKTALYPYAFSNTKLYSWHNTARQTTFSWYMANPDSPIGLLNRETWFLTPQNRFPLLQSPVSVCFTSLHLVLGIVLVMWGLYAAAWPWKLIPWCSCCFCIYINGIEPLELSFGINRTLVTLTPLLKKTIEAQ